MGNGLSQSTEVKDSTVLNQSYLIFLDKVSLKEANTEVETKNFLTNFVQSDN